MSQRLTTFSKALFIIGAVLVITVIVAIFKFLYQYIIS